jgi:apolipoprotein D and lipocalin family protein
MVSDNFNVIREMKAICLSLFIFFITMQPADSQTLQTVEHVEIDKYLGRWYDIASYPASFQKGCHCTTADYELVPGKKYIRVTNRCIKFKGNRSKLTVASGKAFVINDSTNARLKVQFFWPFKGDYYIIGLADDYSWAIVGHPGRKYLWILSRESYMPADVYNNALKIVKQKGYDVNRLQKTPQNCDSRQ